MFSYLNVTPNIILTIRCALFNTPPPKKKEKCQSLPIMHNTRTLDIANVQISKARGKIGLVCNIKEALHVCDYYLNLNAIPNS